MAAERKGRIDWLGRDFERVHIAVTGHLVDLP
jgi:hypothetical protein